MLNVVDRWEQSESVCVVCVCVPPRKRATSRVAMANGKSRTMIHVTTEESDEGERSLAKDHVFDASNEGGVS